MNIELVEMMARRLAEYLRTHTNSKTPIKGKDLAKRLQFEDEQEVRAAVNMARRLGYPIASGWEGYFFAFRSDELASTLGHLEGRRRSIHEAEIGLRNSQVALMREGK